MHNVIIFMRAFMRECIYNERISVSCLTNIYRSVIYIDVCQRFFVSCTVFEHHIPQYIFSFSISYITVYIFFFIQIISLVVHVLICKSIDVFLYFVLFWYIYVPKNRKVQLLDQLWWKLKCKNIVMQYVRNKASSMHHFHPYLLTCVPVIHLWWNWCFPYLCYLL